MARKTATATTEPLSAAGPLTPEEAGRRLSDLFEEHGRMVYGVCRILLRDPLDAEDASQQTFLSAHRSLLAGTRPRDPAAWLGTIARNECRDRIRARATAPLALAGDPSDSAQPDDVTSRREEIEALSAALAELPHQQREAIVLREFYGLSYDEVRAALGVSEAAVESLIFRARKRLRKELRPARVASGAVALPIALHDSLAHAIPGFAGAQRAGIVAKLAGAPVAAKLAAATLAVTVAGVVGTTAVQRQHHDRAPAVDRGVAANASQAPTPVLAVADSFTTRVSPGHPSEHGPKAHDGHGRNHSSRDNGGGHHASQGDQEEPSVALDADQDQSSVVEDTDDGSPNPAQDSGNADADDSGGNASSTADGNESSGADDNTGDTSGDG